jgi:hypothetical protein
MHSIIYSFNDGRRNNKVKNESNLIVCIALINRVYTLINESGHAMELALLKMKKMDRII